MRGDPWEERAMDAVMYFPFAVSERLPWRWARFIAYPVTIFALGFPVLIFVIPPLMVVHLVRDMWREAGRKS